MNNCKRKTHPPSIQSSMMIWEMQWKIFYFSTHFSSIVFGFSRWKHFQSKVTCIAKEKKTTREWFICETNNRKAEGTCIFFRIFHTPATFTWKGTVDYLLLIRILHFYSLYRTVLFIYIARRKIKNYANQLKMKENTSKRFCKGTFPN